MLSHKLSKILAKKNVPHTSGKWWAYFFKTPESFCLFDTDPSDDRWVTTPAYSEIALFKYAKVIWGEEQIHVNSCPKCGFYREYSKHETRLFCPEDGRKLKEEWIVEEDSNEPWGYHTHTLADLFSSGASLETIENYVLESLG